MIATIFGALAAIAGVVLLILKQIFGKAAAKKKLCDEARREYEDAVKTGDTSAITAAMSRINKLC